METRTEQVNASSSEAKLKKKIHPATYLAFKMEALKQCKKRSRVSGKAIVEKLRYTSTISKRGGEKYKINNSLISTMVNMFVDEYPRYRHKFLIKNRVNFKEAGAS